MALCRELPSLAVPSGVSVVIAARNEEASIAAAVDSAYAAGADEVIVVDGASSDHTATIARAHRARVVPSQPMRSRQFNLGAHEAANETIIFLHGDTTLPPGAAHAAAGTGANFGGFRLRFDQHTMKLRIAAALINFRTAITRCPWGDQAQFVRRTAFLAAGGFREIAIMEDYDLARRMRRLGRTAVIADKVTTSARRFLQKGAVRTVILNWRIIAAWHCGVDPDTLARWYRGSE